MTKSKDPQVSRRNFMKAAIFTIGGVIGGAIGIPAIPYIIGPALKQGDEGWVRLGAVSKVELDVPTLFKTTIKTSDRLDQYRRGVFSLCADRKRPGFHQHVQCLHASGLPGALDS